MWLCLHTIFNITSHTNVSMYVCSVTVNNYFKKALVNKHNSTYAYTYVLTLCTITRHICVALLYGIKHSFVCKDKLIKDKVFDATAKVNLLSLKIKN